MKMPPIIEIEDDNFLSQVAAIEAEALSNKRRKITTTTAAPAGNSRTTPKEEPEADGLYTAALRGYNSLLSLQKTSSAKRGANVVTAAGNDGAFVGGGSCFKCGKPGHWARDCVDGGAGGGGGVGGYGGGGCAGNFVKDESVAEKACPCGLGVCIVLTANTERNRGRKFYKCPVREENGGCGFFEWCDSAAGTNMTSGSLNFGSNSSFQVIQCPCGAGSCQILTAKSGKNVGQQFYRCPANQGSSCGFFKWCNDLTVGDGVSASTHRSSCNMSDNSKPNYNPGSGSTCYKCGKEGHWARDCSMTAMNSSAERSRSGTCYKCNKAGHWATDCPS